MTQLTVPSPYSLTCAESAAANHAGNLRALRCTQPQVAAALTGLSPSYTWLCARDGALSAQDARGRWITDCSVPRAAARAMLESLEAREGTACFIEPTHAAQVRAALDRLQPNQGLLAVVSDLQVLDFILAGDDFTAELAHGRLWFACGPNWFDELAAILANHEGFPTATLFIRLPITPDDVAESRMTFAREVFTAESTRRAGRIAELKAAAALRERERGRQRICVAAPSRFRLQDDTAWMLRHALASPPGDDTFNFFDPDRPTDASSLALARVAAESDAIVTANVFRADVTDVVAAQTAWVTWVTLPRIAPFRPECPADRLLLADESFHEPARAAGWPIDRLRLATWPALPVPAPAGDGFVLISNTRQFDAPPAEFALSSHQLLWELIAGELTRDALSLGGDLHGYITTQMQRLGIPEEGLDRAAFIEQLIQPAYEQAVARALIHHRLPLRIHGEGWQQLDAFREHALGAVTTRAALFDAVRDARVLVQASPMCFAGPIDALGRPVLRTAGLDDAALARAARALLAPRPAFVLPSLTPLSRSLVLDLTRTT